MSLMSHQIAQNRWDSEKALKNEDIKPNISILTLSVEKWQAFDRGGVGGVFERNSVIVKDCICKSKRVSCYSKLSKIQEFFSQM